MNKKAYIDGFLYRCKELGAGASHLLKHAASDEAVAAAEGARTRFLEHLGNYKTVADEALKAYQRGTAYSYDWFGRPTEYPSMVGRDFNHFSKSVQNRGLYSDIARAISLNSPEAQEYTSTYSKWYNPWKFTERFLKGMQPYIDRRTDAIKNDPWSYSKANWDRLHEHVNGDLEGMELLEAMYDKEHADELAEAAQMAVLPDPVKDSYQKALIWGAFNPANYEKK